MVSEKIIVKSTLSVVFVLCWGQCAAAMYDPMLGRFASRDPIGYWGGAVLYAFVEARSLICLDPTGLLEIIIPRPVIRPIAPPAPPRPGLPWPPVGGPPVVVPMPPSKEPKPKGPDPDDFPDDQPFKEPWDFPGNTNRKGDPCPSDCSPAKVDDLNKKVDAACKGGKLPKCDDITIFPLIGYSCDDIRDLADKYQDCCRARRSRELQCFRGGDKGHRIQIAQCEYHASVCWWRFRKEGCPITLDPGGIAAKVPVIPFVSMFSDPLSEARVFASRH